MPLRQQSGAIFDRLIRGEATPAEYVEAVRREVRETMPTTLAALRRKWRGKPR